MQRTLATHLKLGFLRTADIAGPVWDQAEDWAHPEIAFRIIAQRIAEEIPSGLPARPAEAVERGLS